MGAIEDSLNEQVTKAAMDATYALGQASEALEKLIAAERAIAASTTIPEDERAIAHRGVGLAQAKLAVIETLRSL